MGEASGVLLIRVPRVAEQLLQDLRERIGVEETEALARDAADDDVISCVGRLPRAEDVVSLREHGPPSETVSAPPDDVHPAGRPRRIDRGGEADARGRGP